MRHTALNGGRMHGPHGGGHGRGNRGHNGHSRGFDFSSGGIFSGGWGTTYDGCDLYDDCPVELVIVEPSGTPGGPSPATVATKSTAPIATSGLDLTNPSTLLVLGLGAGLLYLLLRKK